MHRLITGRRASLAAVLIVALQAGLQSPLPASAGLPTDNSVTVQIDAAHSGGQPSDPLKPPLYRQWHFDFRDAINYPLIADGRVFATAGPLLYAFDLQTGTQIWGPIDLGARYNYLAYDGGRLFVHSSFNFLRAVDPATGHSIWLRQLPNQLGNDSAPVAFAGTIYALGNGEGGDLYAINEADGTTRWELSDCGDTRICPIIGMHTSVVATSTGIYLDSNCGWNYDFNPADGSIIWATYGYCTTGAGAIPALYQGRFYSRDNATLGGTSYIWDAATGTTTGYPIGAFKSDQPLAFSGSTGFFVNGGQLQAQNLSGTDFTTQTPAWTFSGDGPLTTAPVAANGVVYIGSSTGSLYAVDSSNGQKLWSDTGLPAMASEYAPSEIFPAFALGQGYLAVPASNTLIVYSSAPPTGQPGPRPIPAQSFPPSPSGAPGSQTSFQVDSAHGGWQSADTTAPPLAFAWAQDFASTPTTPVIANGRAFLAANDLHGINAPSVYAFNLLTGALDWGPIPAGNRLTYDQGRVFVINQVTQSSAPAGVVTALDESDGHELWTHTFGYPVYIFNTEPVAANGFVYVEATTGYGSPAAVYALREGDGSVAWSAGLQSATFPAVTGSGVYFDNACWAFAFNPLTGQPIWDRRVVCSGGGGTIPAVANGLFYFRDPLVGNARLDPGTGGLQGVFSGDRTPAFYGSLGFFSLGSHLMAEDLATSTVDWTFDGDGSLNNGPIIVDGNVYVGSASGRLYALRARDGAQLWSGDVGSPIHPQEDQVLGNAGSSLAAGGNMLLVPALNRVVAYTHCGATATQCATPTPAPPVVSSIDVTGNNPEGGNTVYLHGSGFTGATAVHFGTSPATRVNVVSASEMSAVSPAGQGTVHITVTTAAGTSTPSNADLFAYLASPVITGISPSHGPGDGGTKVTITGNYLYTTTAVHFGPLRAASLTVKSSTEVDVISPPGAGTVDITVTTYDRGSSLLTAADRFTFDGPSRVATSTTSRRSGEVGPPPHAPPCNCSHQAVSPPQLSWAGGVSTTPTRPAPPSRNPAASSASPVAPASEDTPATLAMQAAMREVRRSLLRLLN
jgi:outer membrane protein assembly factor BamB